MKHTTVHLSEPAGEMMYVHIVATNPKARMALADMAHYLVMETGVEDLRFYLDRTHGKYVLVVPEENRADVLAALEAMGGADPVRPGERTGL